MTSDAYEQARRLFEQGAVSQSFDACRAALAAGSTDARLLLLMARIYRTRGQVAPAAQCAAEAARRLPNNAFAHAFLAHCQLTLNQLSEARASALRAFSLGPADATSWDMLGFVFARLHMTGQARDAFQQAVRLAPNTPQYWLNLGAALAVMGDVDGATRAYETCIDRDENFKPAYLSLVNLRPATPERNYIAKLEEFLGAMGDDSDEAAQLGYALARSLEELGQHERAMAAYERAKRKVRADAKFSIERERAIFAASAATASGRASRGHPSDAAIFVVGMPRSGTTLVERIVSAHPDVASAGELPTFPALVRKTRPGQSQPYATPAMFKAAATGDLAALGRAYEGDARTRLARETPRFVDKLPLNFLFAGLIHGALPNARILCLRRDPMDTVVGNYRQFLGGGGYDYSYDLEDTARYFILFDQLIAHWRANLPTDRFTEVNYEGLVAEPERETRRIIAFCGLSWDARCLAPHENDEPIATLSSAQVREPINTKSIGRWRRYGNALEPARRILAEAGLV